MISSASVCTPWPCFQLCFVCTPTGGLWLFWWCDAPCVTLYSPTSIILPPLVSPLSSCFLRVSHWFALSIVRSSVANVDTMRLKLNLFVCFSSLHRRVLWLFMLLRHSYDPLTTTCPQSLDIMMTVTASSQQEQSLYLRYHCRANCLLIQLLFYGLVWCTVAFHCIILSCSSVSVCVLISWQFGPQLQAKIQLCRPGNNAVRDVLSIIKPTDPVVSLFDIS